MQKKTMLAIVLAVTAVLAGGISRAAEKAPAAPVIAFVDAQKVINECDEAKRGMEDLKTQQTKMQQKLDRMMEVCLLSDEQRKEAETLDAIEKPTDVQTKRANELTGEAKKYEDELKSLQQTNSPTDQQKTRLNELTSRKRAVADQYQKLGEEYTTSLQGKFKSLNDKIVTKVKSSIEIAGKAKGAAVVLDKGAVLYGGTDITSDVMALVNKK